MAIVLTTLLQRLKQISIKAWFVIIITCVAAAIFIGISIAPKTLPTTFFTCSKSQIDSFTASAWKSQPINAGKAANEENQAIGETIFKTITMNGVQRAVIEISPASINQWLNQNGFPRQMSEETIMVIRNGIVRDWTISRGVLSWTGEVSGSTVLLQPKGSTIVFLIIEQQFERQPSIESGLFKRIFEISS